MSSSRMRTPARFKGPTGRSWMTSPHDCPRGKGRRKYRFESWRGSANSSEKTVAVRCEPADGRRPPRGDVVRPHPFLHRSSGRPYGASDQPVSPELRSLPLLFPPPPDFFRSMTMPSKEKDYVSRYHKAWVKSRRAAFDALKIERGCYDCGGFFPPEALDWDHLPGTQKLFPIAEALSQGIPLEKIFSEIEKCQCVCACCHRTRTRNRNYS